MKTNKITFGTLVRDTVNNRSGVVYEVNRKHCLVKFADGTVRIIDKDKLEVNPNG